MFSDIYFRLLLEVMSKDKNIHKIPFFKFSDDNDYAFSSVKIFYRLIDTIYQQHPESSIGLEFGRQVKPINACDFSRVVVTAKNVLSGLTILVNQYPKLHLKPFPMLHVDKNQISIALSFPYEEPLYYGAKRFCSETFFSFCRNLLLDLVDKPVNPIALYLDYPEPSYADEYKNVFGCKIVFNAPLSMVVFDRDIGALPLSSWNENLHEVYVNKAETSWHKIKRQQTFEYRTLSQLMLDAPASFNGQYLAACLSISPRGLQKRLSAEGRSFSLICQLARRELIKVCLFQRKNDFEEIASSLGFQSQVSLRNFFKLHLGVNPKTLDDSSAQLLETI